MIKIGPNRKKSKKKKLIKDLNRQQKNNTIESGYYDVSVRYSLDRNVSHQYTKKAKLKIK